MDRETKRMKMKTVESLVCLVKSLENQNVTIDLQNETSVCGFVKNVDWYLFYYVEIFILNIINEISIYTFIVI